MKGRLETRRRIDLGKSLLCLGTPNNRAKSSNKTGRMEGGWAREDLSGRQDCKQRGGGQGPGHPVTGSFNSGEPDSSYVSFRQEGFLLSHVSNQRDPDYDHVR